MFAQYEKKYIHWVINNVITVLLVKKLKIWLTKVLVTILVQIFSFQILIWKFAHGHKINIRTDSFLTTTVKIGMYIYLTQTPFGLFKCQIWGIPDVTCILSVLVLVLEKAMIVVPNQWITFFITQQTLYFLKQNLKTF
jgi:hypothetical protein